MSMSIIQKKVYKAYPDFNYKQYISNYTDLQRANILTEQAACNHWYKYGIREQRSYKPIILKITLSETTAKYESVIVKYEANDTNTVNIVVISSKIKVSDTKYTYGNTRSIYKMETRFIQTLNTIESIRKYIPNSFIILVDNSELPENMFKILSNMTDIFSNDFQSVELNKYTDNTIHKFIGETAQLVHISGIITSVCEKYNVIGLFKISGRYVINDKFIYTQFVNENNIFKLATDVPMDNYYYTCFYKIGKSYIDTYINHNAHILKNIDYYIKYPNNSLEIILPELITDKKLIDCLGITQYISVFNIINDI